MTSNEDENLAKGISMLVRSYGISVQPGNTQVETAKVFERLAIEQGKPDTSKANERRFYVDNNDPNFVRGLVVTVKDQKEFCELIKDGGGSFIINVKRLEGENKLMEFNFFVINKENGLGLYQHYHQSCTPNTFGSYLRDRYSALCDEAEEHATHTANVDAIAAGRKKAAGRIVSQIKKSHKGRLEFSILVHKESLALILAKFKTIKAFEFEYSAISNSRMPGVPIAPYVKRLREKVTFEPKSDKEKLVQAIQATVLMLQPKSGRISAVEQIDDDEVPVSLRIADIPEHFGEEDYEKVADKLDKLDLQTFYDHEIVKELIEKCTVQHKNIFMKKVKNS